jgi:hypothetical protein
VDWVVVIVAGYVAGLPALRWTLRDVHRVHPHLWDTFGHPQPWRRAAALSYLAGGWPVIVTAGVWRCSPARRKCQTAKRDWLDRRRSRNARSV